MSPLNLQCVGLMREKMNDEFKTIAQRCKNLKDLRRAPESADFKSIAIYSVSHIKAMLFGRSTFKNTFVQYEAF